MNYHEMLHFLQERYHMPKRLTIEIFNSLIMFDTIKKMPTATNSLYTDKQFTTQDLIRYCVAFDDILSILQSAM